MAKKIKKNFFKGPWGNKKQQELEIIAENCILKFKDDSNTEVIYEAIRRAAEAVYESKSLNEPFGNNQWYSKTITLNGKTVEPGSEAASAIEKVLNNVNETIDEAFGVRQ
jgi:hypothetical protein